MCPVEPRDTTHVYGWLKAGFGMFCLGRTCNGIFCLVQCNLWQNLANLGQLKGDQCMKLKNFMGKYLIKG